MKEDLKQPASSLKFRKGKVDCWEEVLTRTIPLLYGMFINRQAHPALAEELAQRTVFDVVRNRGQYDPSRGSPEQWIFSIGKNNLALVMRQRQRETQVYGDLMKYLEAVGSERLPDEVLERKETADLVRRAMEGLEEKERAVLKAKYLDDLPARQIGKQLQMTEKAVHSLLYRARNALRDKLTELAPLFQETQR